jgi:hypothetical protein
MIYSGEALGAGCNLLMLHCTDVLQQSDARGQERRLRALARCPFFPP